jgi:uncharacterized protein
MNKDPFVIKVNELLREVGGQMEVVFEGRPHFEEKPPELVGNLLVDLVITNTEQTLLVTGKISGRMFLKCGRCQKTYIQPFKLNIEEQFARREKIREIKGAGEFELKEPDFIFQINSNETIDLKELIRQNILMNLPIKPLCSLTCPRVDKNVRPAADPRFEELKKIKNKLKEKE